MEFRKLKETYHPHQVTVHRRVSIPRNYRSPRVPSSSCRFCKRHFDDPSPPTETYVPRRPFTRPKGPQKFLPRRPITMPKCLKLFPACTPQIIDRTPPPPPPGAFESTYGLGH
ncbi:Uncharacterized protein Rs2_38986 [Raphanus sativus]|nr:Uncharacterized protein Rs2_38986 [Raphanus sativus]